MYNNIDHIERINNTNIYIPPVGAVYVQSVLDTVFRYGQDDKTKLETIKIIPNAASAC